MFAPLLSTKFHIPRRQPLSQRSIFVVRSHLCTQLTQGLTGQLTLLAAPAGFGKSTLLSQWIGDMEAGEGAAHTPTPTAILTRHCAPLCAAILASAPPAAGTEPLSPRDSQAILEQIVHANLFLVPLDDEGQGYRYHQLFAEVLPQRLRQQQQGRLAAALQAYAATAQLSIAANHRFLSVAAPYHEARILMTQGAPQQAAATYRQVLTTAAQAKKPVPVVGLAHIGYGEILYQWNELAAATQQVKTGLALSPRRDVTYTDGLLHRFSILACIQQAVGDQPGAVAAVALATTTAQQTGIALDVERAVTLAALLHLRLDDTARAALGAEQYTQRRTAAEQVTYLHEFETLVLVRILLAQERAAEALARLTAWQPIVAAAERQGSVIEP